MILIVLIDEWSLEGHFVSSMTSLIHRVTHHQIKLNARLQWSVKLLIVDDQFNLSTEASIGNSYWNKYPTMSALEYAKNNIYLYYLY